MSTVSLPVSSQTCNLADKMAANGRGSLRPTSGSKTPPFLIVGLLIVTGILAFNYWSVSSKNGLLGAEVEELGLKYRSTQSKKLDLEKHNGDYQEKINLLQQQLKESEVQLDDEKKKVQDIDMKLNNLAQEMEAVRNDLNTCDDEVGFCHENVTRMVIANRKQLEEVQIQCRQEVDRATSHGEQRAANVQSPNNITGIATNDCEAAIDAKRISLLKTVQQVFGTKAIVLLKDQANQDVTGIDLTLKTEQDFIQEKKLEEEQKQKEAQKEAELQAQKAAEGSAHQQDDVENKDENKEPSNQMQPPQVNVEANNETQELKEEEKNTNEDNEDPGKQNEEQTKNEENVKKDEDGDVDLDGGNIDLEDVTTATAAQVDDDVDKEEEDNQDANEDENGQAVTSRYVAADQANQIPYAQNSQYQGAQGRDQPAVQHDQYQAPAQQNQYDAPVQQLDRYQAPAQHDQNLAPAQPQDQYQAPAQQHDQAPIAQSPLGQQNQAPLAQNPLDQQNQAQAQQATPQIIPAAAEVNQAPLANNQAPLPADQAQPQQQHIDQFQQGQLSDQSALKQVTRDDATTTSSRYPQEPAREQYPQSQELGRNSVINQIPDQGRLPEQSHLPEQGHIDQINPANRIPEQAQYPAIQAPAVPAIQDAVAPLGASEGRESPVGLQNVQQQLGQGVIRQEAPLGQQADQAHYVAREGSMEVIDAPRPLDQAVNQFDVNAKQPVRYDTHDAQIPDDIRQ